MTRPDKAVALKWWRGYRERHPELCDQLEGVVSAVKPYIPPLNFITLHYAYFVATTIIATLIFWGSSSPAKSISWWDSMFMCMSAVTGSGLNTINVSQLTTFQQVVLTALMIMGSQVLVSYFTIAFRKHIFEKRFEDIVEMEKENRKAKKGRTGALVGMTGAMFGLPVMSTFGKGPKQVKSRPPLQKFSSDPSMPNHTRFSPGRASDPGPGVEPPSSPLEGATDQHLHIGFLEPIQEGRTSKSQDRPQTATTGYSIYNVHSNQSANTRPTRRRTQSEDTKFGDEFNVQTFVREQKRNIGRNGQFFNLSSDQREYLGGVEYRALKFLSVFVLLYFVLWQLFGAIALGAYMSVWEKEASAVNTQNPWWAGIFLAISAYNNTGFTLLDAGFIPFQDSYYILTVVTILSLAGPAAFPVFIRFLIWTMSKALYLFSKNKDYGMWREGFDFILKFPRRVYTSMFAARDTWLFIATFGSFVAADWVLILILSIGNPTMEVVPLGRRIFIALFEGFC
jgi:hypothetical protein